MITVRQMIEALQKLNKDLPCGVSGHYGEFYSYEDFPNMQEVRIEWESSKMMSACIFEVLDIGPEPD